MVNRQGMRILAGTGLRWTGRLVAALALVFLVVAGSLLLPGVRGRILEAATGKALEAFPGEVTGTWSWPDPDRLEGRNLVWTVQRENPARTDTLAVVDSLSCRFDLVALWHHDLEIEESRIRIRRWDIPGTMTALAVPDSGTREPSRPAKTPFLRPGGLPGAPALKIHRLTVHAERLVLPGNARIDGWDFEAGADLLPGAAPSAVITRMRGRVESFSPPVWSLELETLQGAGAYEPATRTVRLDSLSALLPRFVFTRDSLILRAGPLDLAAAGSLQGGTADAQATIRFQAEVPAGMRQPVPGTEFRSLGGRLKVRAAGTAQEMRVDGILDLDPTDDVGVGHLAGSLQVGTDPPAGVRSARLDTLNLRWRRANLSAGGTWDAGMIRGNFAADLADFELPLLFMPSLSGKVDGHLRLVGAVEGPDSSPRMSGSLVAACDIDSVWGLPGLADRAGDLPADFPSGDFQRVNADLTAGVEGTWSDLVADLRLDLRRTPWLDKGLLAGRLEVDPRMSALKALRLDTLAVAADGVEVTASGLVDTAGIDLEGVAHLLDSEILARVRPDLDLGADAEVRVEGPWAELGGRARIAGHAVSGEFAVPDFRTNLVFEHGEVTLRTILRGGVILGPVDVDSLRVDWEGEAGNPATSAAGAFALMAWAPQAEGMVRGRTVGDSLRTIQLDTLAVSSTGKTMHTAGPMSLVRGPRPSDLALKDWEMLGDLGRFNLDFTAQEGRVDARTDADLSLTQEWLDTVFPSPFWSAGGGLDLDLAGEMELSRQVATGGGAVPVFRGQAELGLIPRNGKPSARLDGRFHLAGRDTSALLASLGLSVGDTHLLHGTIFWPGRFDSITGFWAPQDQSAGGLHIPEQELPLGYLSQFLPGEVTLDGTVTVGADVEADTGADDTASSPNPGNRKVKGIISTKGLKIGLPNLSRAEVDGSLGIGGRVIDPLVEGKITVSSGLYRLPEMQRTLHSVTGTSALWDAGLAAAKDSLQAAGPPLWTGPEIEESPQSTYLPDLDVQVLVPGNFHVSSYGFQAELGGDFKVRRGWDEAGQPFPVLRGQIYVLDGELRALNRVFDIERGELNFEGKVPVDPRLDVVMVAQVEGTTVRIKVTGTALNPVIVLESDPAMLPPDIMAVLVFGRPVNELDPEQQDNLTEQATPTQQLMQNIQDLVMVFGSQGIEKSVSGRIGLDQIRVGPGRGGNALILGKFLNPRMLLKYQQSLVRSGTYNMTVEYTLNRLLRLISTYGHEEASGLELRWQSRY